MQKLLLFAMVFLAACVSQDANLAKDETKDVPHQTEDTTQVVIKKYPEDAKFNDFAQFITGNEGSETSSLKSLETSNKWKSYQASLDKLWKRTNDKLPTIKQWTKEELADINTDGGTLFYPFAGADFLHADLFFPEYDNIVMIALEPIGNFPDLNSKSDSTLGKYLSNLKKSMHAILGLSFFRTIAMASDFHSKLDGTLHVLIHFMARTDHEILYQEQIAIQTNGELTTDLSNISDSTYIGNRYYFRRNGEQRVRTLTYFAANIQNIAYYKRGNLFAKGLNTRKDLIAYFKRLDIKTTYLKSASYVLHHPSFSIVRNLILNESEHILQDDSAIPVQYFDTTKWDLTFYVNYTRPIPLFTGRHQEDLYDIYSGNQGYNIKPLPFGVGYKFRKGTSNMMLGTKN